MAHSAFHRPQAVALLGSLGLIGILACLVGLWSGPGAMSVGTFWQALVGSGDPFQSRLLYELRWPRVAGSFAVGGSLALSGALLQVLLRNPLADPYVLGTAGGAATGALAALLLGATGYLVGVSAFAGALLATTLVFGLAFGPGTWTPTRLILTGVIVAAGFNAVISFILVQSPQSDLGAMLFWLMGDLSRITTPLAPWLGLLLGLAWSLALARPLNVLRRGELNALALGVNLPALRLQIFALASLLTAAAVTTAGAVGFVGLVAPHVLRLLGASDHRLLLPASVLLGGSLVVAADTCARTVLAPQQLPVGIITAALGIPLFLYLLRTSHRA